MVTASASVNGAYATLGSISDKKEPRGYICPCKPTPGERHPWRPTDCGLLEFAIRGSTSRLLSATPTAIELEAIRERLQTSLFTEVRRNLERKGWDIGNGSLSGVKYPGTVEA